MTLVQVVNEVLKQLRENTVNATTDTRYATLIARLVNIAKRQVENAWNWIGLRTTVTVNATTGGGREYTLTGTNGYTRILRAYNTTKKCKVSPISWEKAAEQETVNPDVAGDVEGYRISGFSSGELKVKIYPLASPDQTIVFEVVVPQPYLSSDATSITVPEELVIHSTFALAVAERGDDGGLAVQDAASVYKTALADLVSIENELLDETETIWRSV